MRSHLISNIYKTIFTAVLLIGSNRMRNIFHRESEINITVNLHLIPLTPLTHTNTLTITQRPLAILTQITQTMRL